MKNPPFHIGAIIRKQLKDKGQSASWLAAQCNCDRSNFYRILQKHHIDIELLLRISTILQHDFFIYYSQFAKENEQK